MAVLIYIPFVRLQEKFYCKIRENAFLHLKQEIQYIQGTGGLPVLARHDEVGDVARELVAELDSAFKAGDASVPLNIEYQPKVDCQGRVVGAEALLRWTHSIYGYVSPMIIVSLCDEAGLTTELGNWVIRHSFGELKKWHDKGYGNIVLSVNINPRQIQEGQHLIKALNSCMSGMGIDPRFMELELTENAAIEMNDISFKTLRQIKEAGINLSIDDFGMGHSSLRYIYDFHANIIKMDSELIRDIVNNKQKESIVEAIISLCSKLNVQVVIAEGVETQAQADLLSVLGCQVYQGFYYSRSLSSDRFLEYVDKMC